MDYKEKYEQALEVAKETYNKQPMYREWLEKMFSELSESEDEKVRKCLIDFFEDWRENRSHCWGIAVSKILAWLENIPVTIDHEKREGFHLGYKACHEKQGEKSVKWNENTDGNKPQKHHSVLMKTTHGITEGEWKGNESWIQYRWSSSIKDSDVLSWMELSDLEKQGETSPVLSNSSNIGKDEDDEEMKTLLRTEYEKGRADAIAEMQKEWSLEDEIYYKRVQLSIEWARAHNRISEGSCDEQLNWLKSLRPQNRWGPSDEQMKALNYVVNLMASSESPKENDYYYNVFKDLRKQLKKLKE